MTPARLGGLDARVLGRGDLAALQDVLERCADFITLDDGAPPGPGAAEEALTSLPPGHPPGDQLVVGLAEPGADRLIGVIGLLRGYPSAGEWWIGTFMLDPSVRGRGLGGAIMADLEGWLRGEGGARVYLAVLERNPDALRFWERVGFRELDRRLRKGGKQPDPCVRMARAL